MKIVGFIWLEEIVEKLEVKHQAIPEEVESFLSAAKYPALAITRAL